jgi:hypothetical protein
MFRITAVAAVSTLLIAAAPAHAKSCRGKTNQGRTASLVTGAGDRWVGTLAVRELFARKGRVIDVCEVKRIRFTLS